MTAAMPILPPTSPRVMSTEEYLDALKTLYMPAYSRTTARELGMKVKEAEAIANGAPIPEAVAMRLRGKHSSQRSPGRTYTQEAHKQRHGPNSVGQCFGQ